MMTTALYKKVKNLINGCGRRDNNKNSCPYSPRYVPIQDKA